MRAQRRLALGASPAPVRPAAVCPAEPDSVVGVPVVARGMSAVPGGLAAGGGGVGCRPWSAITVAASGPTSRPLDRLAGVGPGPVPGPPAGPALGVNIGVIDGMYPLGRAGPGEPGGWNVPDRRAAEVSSWARSAALAGRCVGSLARRLMTTASRSIDTSGARCRSGAGSTNRWAPSTSPAPSWVKGGRPLSISYRMQPSAYRSARWSTSPEPLHCSGDMYVGVPITAPVVVWLTASALPLSLAMPKSSSLVRAPVGISGSGTRKMLSGLRSRWTMPWACTAASELHTLRTIHAASPSPMRPWRRMYCDSGSPSRNSITM